MFRIDAKVDVHMDVHVHPAADEAKITSMLNGIVAALQRIESNMATGIQQVLDHMATVIANVEQLKTIDQSVKAALDGQAALIADLRRQIAEGGITDLTQVDQKLSEIETGVAQVRDDLVAAVQTGTGG